MGWIARAAALAAVLLPASLAAADDNDLVLSRLGDPTVDGTGMVTHVAGDDQAFRSLASELGVVLAPRLVAPADTLGFGGFQFTADLAFTGIHSGTPYWRALASSPDPTGTAIAHGADVMQTIGVFARKGFWFPLPSFELGVGAVHLVSSHMWTAQGYAKLAIAEGYHDLPLPSLAVRGGVSRMMGSEQLDLTIASVDVTVSKAFGLGGVVNLAPYLGWDWLVIVPRSEVIDRTPDVDVRTHPGDINANFVFHDQASIVRDRLFAGVKLKYYVFMLGLEAAMALPGSSVDDRAGTSVACSDVMTAGTACDAHDQAGRQTTFTTTLGFDF